MAEFADGAFLYRVYSVITHKRGGNSAREIIKKYSKRYPTRPWDLSQIEAALIYLEGWGWILPCRRSGQVRYRALPPEMINGKKHKKLISRENIRRCDHHYCGHNRRGVCMLSDGENFYCPKMWSGG